ncbi:MAG TPA: heme o synthase [Dongiaceae bacterium]|nr:heme o synthase [Dongiaceae bacterium]
MERHTRSYFQLIKPGITLSNTMTGVAGFLLAASVVPFRFLPLVGATGGIALVIASACVANNVLDRDIDKRMKRTAKRDVARGAIGAKKALVFSALLGFAGFAFLAYLTNTLTFMLGLLAYVWYVVIYGVTKRTTPLSTIIGAVAGALPPMAGYTALTGRIDAAAVILFLILFFWQLPHFYAIAMFRKNDYAAAKIPVWSVKYGLKSTKVQIFWSVVVYALIAPLLTVYSYTGIIYAVVSSALSIYWVYKGITLYKKVDDEKWAKTMFGVSLLVLLGMCALLAVGGYLP